MKDIHSCSYFCDRPECVKAQRDELRDKLAVYEKAAPLCEKHQPNGGTRSGCLVCAGMKFDAALSRIDYLCGEPNEMECSGYDVHKNEDAVVEHVRLLKERFAALEERLEIAETNNLNDTIAFNMLRKEHADLEKWFADANKKIYYLELYGNKDCTAQAMEALAAEPPKGGNNDW